MLIYAQKAVAVPQAALIGSCRSVCAEEQCLAPGASVWLGMVASPCSTCSLSTDCTHCSLASPPDWSQGPAGLPSKKLSTHQELSSASLSSSRSGSSQGIIIKSMPQLHFAWLCAEQEGQSSGLVCVDSRECLWEERVPMWCSPGSLMGWEQGSKSEPPITSGGKLAKWIGTCSPLSPTGNVNAICFCGKVLSCRTVLHLDNVNINSWKQWC